MKQRLILVLVSLYLLGSTEFHQVLKLPLLISHYAEHSNQVEMTFWEFLVMHYKTDVPHDDHDMSLPFKDCHHSQTAHFASMPAQKFSLFVASADIKTRAEHDPLDVKSSACGEIFQPPRV